jgi:signal transduction histidine kinase/DNA-binding response OmpR family regulator
MLDEMKMELSLHPGAAFIYSDAKGNSQVQVEQVRAMLKKGIDLLVISPNEAQPLTGIVEEVYRKGIPVIVIDRKTSSAQYTAYVGADNYQVGKLAGEYMHTILKGKGNVVEVMGLPGSSPAIERQRGFSDALKRYRDIHIIKQVYGDWLKRNAQGQLLQIKEDLKHANAVFAHNDVMALGSRQVLDRLKLGKQVKVLGIDAQPGSTGGLQMVADGVINASVVYPTGGKEAILTAFQILNKELFKRENILQSLVIDSTNVQLMKLQWGKIRSQQNDIERQQRLLAEQLEIYNNQQLILNIIIVTLVLAVIFGGLAFYALTENRKSNRSLEAKNAEILSQRNQLIEMSARAEVATEAKLNFFTNITHEFRTPLTLILSPLEDMMRSEKENTTAGKNLALIYKNVFRLMRLVNQLIDYRKIEYDKQQIIVSRQNLAEFAKDILDSFQHHAKKRNIQLSFETTEPVVMAWFDENLMDKVFFNLVSNAMKFTKAHGRIELSISRKDDLIQITLRDNGIGMEPAELEQVFEQFYQADHGIAKGSGLGLALTKDIINLHSGKIEVTSKKWQGTTFSILLPCDCIPENAAVRKVAADLLPVEERSKEYVVDLEEAPAANNYAATQIQSEHSILIIEDNRDLLHFLGDKLSSHFQVYLADNGDEGLKEAFQSVPDIIISDVLLPGPSGKIIAETLKTDVRTSHIPIILLTAQVSLEQQIDGIKSMADAYLTKPFSFDHLLATVNNLIKNRLILKEHFSSDVSHKMTPVSKTLDKKFINDVAGIVEQNLGNERFTVDDICKSLNISRVQLYRKVKALLGCSITDYILDRRLKKAKYLLLNEAYSISEITYMVGFSSPNYFATVFKAKYTCTPSEYKKQKKLPG